MTAEGPKHPVLGAEGSAREFGCCRLPIPTAFPDSQLMLWLAVPQGTGRRAVPIYEKQLREPKCPAELGSKWGLEWDHEHLLHPTPEQGGTGSVAPHMPGGAACPS